MELVLESDRLQKADFRRERDFADEMSALSGYESHSAKIHRGFFCAAFIKEHMLL